MSGGRCPVCGDMAGNALGQYRSNSPELFGKQKVECSDCGLVFAAPMPTELEWAQYNSSYFERAHGNTADTQDARHFRSGLARIRCAHVMNYLDRHAIETKTVLEIGPGHGEFVAAFKQARPSTRYLTVESDNHLRGKLERAGAILLSEDDAAVLESEVDLVVISHVLEHTRDPLSFLTTSTKALRKGGGLFVEVPCRDYLYKTSDEPHLLFFDKGSLGCALKASSFVDAELTYHGEAHTDLLQRISRSQFRRIFDRISGRLGRLLPASHDLVPDAEWSVLKSFHAERTLAEPARWLRAMAIKGVS